MPVSRGTSQVVIDTIFQGKDLRTVVEQLRPRPVKETPLPPSLPRETALDRSAWARRLEILSNQGMNFEYLSGKKHVADPTTYHGNIENFLGIAQIPVGVIGPLRINGAYAYGDFYIPLATTEGAMVASYNRGAMAISLSGGARVVCLTEGVSRSPGFIFNDLVQAGQFILWVVHRFDEFKEAVKKTTSHGYLQDVVVTMDGNHVYLNFQYTTGDAAGQNMVTIATEAICQKIIADCPVKPLHWFIESNLSGDKKATAASYLTVRGKKVTAEACIPKQIVSRVLHTTPEKMMEYWKMSLVGGIQSGSIGVQGQYANGLAGLFIACGQDVACVAEAAVGVTRLDIMQSRDLYISISMPNLIVGTVGGGTDLPTQKECLAMLGCKGAGSARKFAEICAATILAGEISIVGALGAGHFTKAHIRYGRKKKAED